MVSRFSVLGYHVAKLVAGDCAMHVLIRNRP
jgi:hypothetical protein